MAGEGRHGACAWEANNGAASLKVPAPGGVHHHPSGAMYFDGWALQNWACLPLFPCMQVDCRLPMCLPPRRGDHQPPTHPPPHPRTTPTCRWITARKKYCRHVEAKLVQRSNLRLQARALVAWTEWQEQQAALQAALRAAVRRMSYVKLYHAFAGERGCREMALGISEARRGRATWGRA